MHGIMKYYKIWLPLLSIVLFVSIAELICRGFALTDKLDADFKFYINNVDDDLWLRYNVEDAFLMWFPKPNYSDGDININSQGFRDKEYKVKKDKNVFRILCLGDSSTFGFGVQLQETYHTLLENRLNKELGHSGIRFEIINAGVTGYTSCQGLGLYKLKGFKYTPDVVTFYFGVNERIKRFYLSDKQIMQHEVPAAIKAAIENNLLLKLDSYRLLRNFMVNILRIGKNNIGENFPLVSRVSTKDFKENILELNRLCKKNGSLLLLISPPYSKIKDLKGNLLISVDTVFCRELLENISKEYNIPLLNIPEMTERSPLDTTPFFLDTVHPNQLGHRMIMERLYDYLVTNKLLP
jgi:lysophospholipase L1-like esterase